MQQNHFAFSLNDFSGSKHASNQLIIVDNAQQ